jgi:hypothetical protein
VLNINVVVILAPLIHLGVGLDIGRVGANKATVAVIARGATNGGATSLGVETMTVLDIGAVIARGATNGGATSLGVETMTVLDIGLACVSAKTGS